MSSFENLEEKEKYTEKIYNLTKILKCTQIIKELN